MDRTIELLDSTLRDGAQGEGISFSVQDKLSIFRLLSLLGIDFIEGGNPGSNPKDVEFFRMAAETGLGAGRGVLAAFGSTRRKGTCPEEDALVRHLLDAGTAAVLVVGKSWHIHAYDILGVTREENLSMIYDTCAFFVRNGRRALFDAEHFFDGWTADPLFAAETLEAAVKGGAECLVLCDTNGGRFPDEVARITKDVVGMFPDVRIGFHGHNDGGMAVANSIAAYDAGASHLQGTFLGFGERCGNANLSTIICNLQLKRGVPCIPKEKLPLMFAAAAQIAETANISVPGGMPYVGRNAFAHKAGMHADGVLKRTCSFEHVCPETVGNSRRFPLSEISGRAAVVRKAAAILPSLKKDSPETEAIINAIKNYERKGYQFDGADASFEMLCRKETGSYKPFFELIDYQIITTGETGAATATVKIRVGDKTQLMAGEGNGPVNALDAALRSALGVFYPSIASVRLTDYKVRVVDSASATAAVVRVLITSADGHDTWTTVGVSANVVEASWFALTDSLEYKLLINNRQ